MLEVAIIGVGWAGSKSCTPDLSFQEMVYEAAVKAYADANVNPQVDVDAFISADEDYWAGYSIFEEYVPDQLGAVLKPTWHITGDGLHALINAYMMIRSNLFEVVVVESHSKASDILSYAGIIQHATDPVYVKPLGGHPFYIAGLEMRRYLYETGVSEEQCAQVVVKNKRNAIFNPNAAYPAELTVEDVLNSPYVFSPLKALEVSSTAEGAIVMVLASGDVARRLTDVPIWVRGVGWAIDTPNLDGRDWGRAVYVEVAADMAYKMAGITNPRRQIHVAEVDDKFSYKELQHVEALRLCTRGEAGELLEAGSFYVNGELPVNPSGGCLGVGNLLEACGLSRALEVVLQLRGQAQGRQVEDAKVGVAQTWRGIPTTSGAVVVLSTEG